MLIGDRGVRRQEEMGSLLYLPEQLENSDKIQGLIVGKWQASHSCFCVVPAIFILLKLYHFKY